MKVMNQHVILFDAACPMCGLYTKAFVRSGMLPEGGRAPYQDPPPACAALIDRERAVNEIALVDLGTGTVTYGVQSLFAILANAFPVLRPLFRLTLFAWLATKAYRFISYNRRVIIPAKGDGTDLPPRFHPGYRIAWILLAWLITASILNHFSGHLVPLVPASSFFREYAICGGQLLWQGALLLWLNPRKVVDYLGNMMTVSLAGGLALGLFDLVFGLSGTVPPVVYAGVFLLVAGAMLLEHARRCRLLGLGWPVSASWVLYRILLLLFILN